MRALHTISLVLIIIGAINWGLVGLFGFDLVAFLFGGADAALARIVYILVGLAGIAALTIFPVLTHRRHHEVVHTTA